MNRLTTTIVFVFLCIAGGFAAYRYTYQSTTQTPTVLMYHGFTMQERGKQYVLPVRNFKEQLKHLSNSGYQSILSDEYVRFLRGEQSLPERSVILTFDDWFPEHYDIVRPLLKEYGFKGIFFVIVNKVGSNPAEQEKIRQMLAEGHEIGSHTVFHSFLSQSPCDKPWKCCNGRTCEEQQLHFEVTQSKQVLEGVTRIPVNSFAWPGNYYNDQLTQRATDAGYQAIYAVEQQTTEDGVLINRPGITKNPQTIYRTEIGGHCQLADFKKSLTSQRCCVVSQRQFYRHCTPQDPS